MRQYLISKNETRLRQTLVQAFEKEVDWRFRLIGSETIRFTGTYKWKSKPFAIAGGYWQRLGLKFRFELKLTDAAYRKEITQNRLPSGELFDIVCHMENYMPSLDSAFHALADPTRRAVVAKLITGPAAVKDLAAPFGMGLPSFLKHLNVLELGGLISSEKVGRVRTCHLNSNRLAAAEDWLSEQRAVWEGRTDRLAACVENNQRQENTE